MPNKKGTDLAPFDLTGDGTRMLRCVAMVDLGAEGTAVLGKLMRAVAVGDNEGTTRQGIALTLLLLPECSDEDLGHFINHPDRQRALIQHAQSAPGRQFPPSSTDPTKRAKHWQQ